MVIRGYLDYFRPPDEIGGWAVHTGYPSESSVGLELRAYLRGSLVAKTRPTIYRNDTNGTHGFRLILPDILVPDVLLMPGFSVSAFGQDAASAPLIATFDLLETARVYIIKRLVAALSPKRRASLISEKFGQGDSGDPTSTQLKPSSGTLSYLTLSPGLVSPDESVVLGHEGYLFIWKGSNNLRDQYHYEIDTALSLAKSWMLPLRSRLSRLGESDTRFLQVVVPEKSSLLPELYAEEIGSETPLLASLDMQIAQEALNDCYLNLLPIMRTSLCRRSIFRRLDSHLTPAGAFFVFSEILNRLGLRGVPRPIFDCTVVQSSDLGVKFDKIPMREAVQFPRMENIATWAGEPKKIVEIISPTGHVGTRVVWANSSSVHPLKVVVFANSFFGLGNNSANLSWWAARCFKEFHFVWSPYLDYDYVAEVLPDIVICQTIERFLPMVPRA